MSFVQTQPERVPPIDPIEQRLVVEFRMLVARADGFAGLRGGASANG
jgi:hypothetical protein